MKYYKIELSKPTAHTVVIDCWFGDSHIHGDIISLGRCRGFEETGLSQYMSANEYNNWLERANVLYKEK